MTRALLVAVASVAFLVGCGTTVQPPSTSISCQPFGYTPAPIVFSFSPGPVASSVAEQTAIALFRTCALPTSSITDLTSSSVAATGVPTGPNAGQPVWLVQVDATVTEPPPQGGTYRSHFMIEINQATDVPTVIAYG